MRFRFLPLVIGAAAIALSLRIGGIWQGLHSFHWPASATSEAPRKRFPLLSEASRIVPAAGEDSSQGQTAEAADQQSEEPGSMDSATMADGADANALRADDPFDLSDEELLLLQQLSERRAELDRRASEIDQRAALLSAAEERIDAKMAELKGLQDTIGSMLIQHDEQEEAQLRSLVKIYENMKPKDAAEIFEQLDMVVLLEVIDRMSERKAAPVLAKMSPAKAKAVTLELAQRRELPIAKN